MIQDEKAIAKDKRLRKTYGWTLSMFYALGEKQEWKCGICGRPLDAATANVDHVHFHVDVIRREDRALYSDLPWQATCREIMPHSKYWGKTKAEAYAACKTATLPHSVRGLLCPGRHRGCNRLLGRVDNPEWLLKAYAYLKNQPSAGIPRT